MYGCILCTDIYIFIYSTYLILFALVRDFLYLSISTYDSCFGGTSGSTINEGRDAVRFCSRHHISTQMEDKNYTKLAGHIEP